MKKIILSLMLLFQSTAFFSAATDYDLGIYQLNRGEFKAAITEFEPLVTEGYAPAQYQMALIYLNGNGVRKDPNHAFELFSLAADQNYPDAQFELGVLYSDGIGIKKNLEMAFVLTEKAAKKGLDSAQFNLGVMYYNGLGIKRNYLKASRWYQKAADQNYALAQFNLALMYYEGKGVAKDTEMSYIWNIISAKNGYVQASKSRDMDEHKLNAAQIQKSRTKANSIYSKIIMQIDLKTKEAYKNLI